MKKKELISRIIVFVLLVFTISPMFTLYSINRYNYGKNLNKEEYLKRFDQYKKELLDLKKSTDFTYSLITTFLGLLIIVGGYEIIIFIIKVIITSKITDKF
ncbi:conserved hypothetical protein [Hyella patelloides LEGE 07179]|uniref:Uncharacterized protein n=1 Tax=Hyella patelloides LEGE 07179 TaxID=945734 RepID=A0A563VNX1_9CYAN|nr:hypothetical protein [Hyella patelloides]VEP13104.1 conserved hypothetical protein [Hyella patelloides LEGE 07179]